ncbi:MAG: flagellar basal body rod protein FlgG [Verrucomicrobia bacterium ADurb.Bin474]|nr:MAG: flagellar basal body rod protein FlgG [Verrucomicrobia bacterium ADurb.Bin474]
MPVQVEDPGLLQGNLEISNVSPLTEMVNLISISRAFEANQKVIQSLDTLEGRSIEVLGAVN